MWPTHTHTDFSWDKTYVIIMIFGGIVNYGYVSVHTINYSSFLERKRFRVNWAKYNKQETKEHEWPFFNKNLILVKYIYSLHFSEICRVQQGGRPPGRDVRLLDVYNEKPVRVSAKVNIPVREHPKVSFTMLVLIKSRFFAKPISCWGTRNKS